MLTNFPMWLQGVNISTSPELVSKRWQGVENAAASLKQAEAVDLARIAFGSQPASADLGQRFRSIFQSIDPAFPMDEAKAELAVLSAATLAEWFEGSVTDPADVAALAVVSRSLGGNMPPEAIPTLESLASSYLRKSAEEARSVDNIQFAPNPAVFNLGPGITGLVNSFDQNSLSASKELFQKTLNQFDAAIAETQKATTEVVTDLMFALQVAREESNIWWWVYNARSVSQHQQYSQMSAIKAALIAGRELFEAVAFVPGPVASQDFLKRILNVTKKPKAKSCLRDTVNATPRDWRQECVATYPSGGLRDMCPALAAVAKSLETDGSDDWIPPYKGTTGFDALHQVPVLALAYQMFIELSLVNRVGEL